MCREREQTEFCMDFSPDLEESKHHRDPNWDPLPDDAQSWEERAELQEHEKVEWLRQTAWLQKQTQQSEHEWRCILLKSVGQTSTT